MFGFRKGDTVIIIHDERYVLRLSMGALAEIDHRLAVNGPLELAEKLRHLSADALSAEASFILLECLLRPALSSPQMVGAIDIPAIARRAKPHVFMAKIAELFEKNFKGNADDEMAL